MANEQVSDQHALIGNAEGKGTLSHNDHEGAKWFFEPVNLGLFIHFGIAAVDGDVDISWGMMDDPVRRAKGNGILTPRAYWALAERFDPQDFHPERWLSAAKEAGFTYAVFTTRHHDGFALFPSEAGDFNTKNYMGGRDLVREFTDACHKIGLKTGLYYSPPDWKRDREYRSFMLGSHSEKYPDRPYKDIDHHEVANLPAMPLSHMRENADYVNRQVRELLTNYGQIDLLWFDGTLPDLTDVITLEEIRTLQPQIVVNDRLWGFGAGDYCSRYECYLPSEKPSTPWETCHIWHVGGGWSYVKNADKYRDLDTTMKQYEVCEKWGGNLLLNIAPDGNGTVPTAYYDSVKALGEAVKARKSRKILDKP